MAISRRDFLKGTAAGIVSTALTGFVRNSAFAETETPEVSDDSSAKSVASSDNRLIGDILNPQDESFTRYTTDYSHIFSPLKIGGVTLKCRLVKSAAGSGTQSSSDWPDKTCLEYYRQFCKGGIGMVVKESSMSIPSSMALPTMGGDLPAVDGLPPMDGLPAMDGLTPMDGLPAMDGLPPMDGLPAMDGLPSLDAEGAMPIGGFLMFTSDAGIPAHQAIADAMHELDTPIIGQIFDLMASGCASSNLRSAALEPNLSIARMQTTEEVQEEVQKFIDSAERYYKAGFDGIELNASCNHYFSTFLSRRVNNERQDQYSGASIENRCRILTEIIEGIRERLGSDFIVQVLFSAVEEDVSELGLSDGCTTVEEAVEFAKLFEKAGASSLHIRSEAYGHHCGGFMPDVFHIPEHGHTGYGTVMEYGRHLGATLGQYDGVGALLDVAAEIKKHVSIPVGAVGNMDPRLAPDLLDSAIADGKVDFLVLNRPLMADPELPNKLREGRRDEVAPCTRCMTCFVAPINMGMPMYCRVNPALTHAYSVDMPEGYDPLPAEVKKNIMVIGGGAAGMEAARIAAQRGHRVKLYEKDTKLGGRLDAVQKLKGSHERITEYKEYLIRQLELNHVEVVTGADAALKDVKAEKPDAVVVAVGSLPNSLDSGVKISGSVMGMSEYINTLRKGSEPQVGNRIVIIGAQFQACELAVSLRKKGRTVTILNPGPESEFYMNGATWPKEMNSRWLRARGVNVYHNIKLNEVGKTEITFDTEYGVTVQVPCDSVIQALPELPNRTLFDEIRTVCDEVYAVGDCYGPGPIVQATSRANIIARRIGLPVPETTGMPPVGQTYSATATGIGDVTVTITVENGKVVFADVDTSNETVGIGRDLGTSFAQQIMTNGSTDAISGASMTSNAVKQAYEECLKLAGLK